MASINPHSRKIQPISYNDMSFQHSNTHHNASAQSPPPQLPPPSQFSNPSPFDSSMALTVLVLLTALFFMGFFSIYLRRLSGNQPSPPTLSSLRRNYPNADLHRPPTAATASHKGASPEVIRSLPVYDYYHGDAKYQIECAICLGEFEEKERVKIIPYCKHVFHLECIDTWLKMHVTCPVCRGTQFFEPKVVVRGGDGGGCSGGSNGDTHYTQVARLSSSSGRCSV